MTMCRLCKSAFWIRRRKLTVQTVIPTFFSVKALKNREGIDRLKGLSCPIYHFIWHYMIMEDTFNPWGEERSCHRVKAIHYTHTHTHTNIVFIHFFLQRPDTAKHRVFGIPSPQKHMAKCFYNRTRSVKCVYWLKKTSNIRYYDKT